MPVSTYVRLFGEDRQVCLAAACGGVPDQPSAGHHPGHHPAAQLSLVSGTRIRTVSGTLPCSLSLSLSLCHQVGSGVHCSLG